MKKKTLIISCKGLGDGLVTLILSNNLHLNGYETVTLHNGSFESLQNWFDHLPIKKFPAIDTVESLYLKYDKVFISHDSVDPFIQKMIEVGKKNFYSKTKVLNPSFSKNIGNQPYYSDTFFKHNIPMTLNMKNFCRYILKLDRYTDKNGIKCPYNLIKNKHPKRIVIHPTSAKPARSWSKEKFIKLYYELKCRGYDPIFIMGAFEKDLWIKGIEKEEIKIKTFDNFDELGKILFEASFFIGNDSGIGHFASALKLAVICLSRSKRTTDLWRPGWGKVKVLYPPRIIPNIKGYRIRDEKWQKFISVRSVLDNVI